MATANPAPEFYPKTRRAWRAWLKKFHATQASVWVICYKKGSNQPTIAYEELVQECLCFGWIDSKPNKIDDEKFKLFCARRKPTSAWSAVNKKRIAQLEKQGLLEQAGLEAIAIAKANGAWSAIDSAQALEEPRDLLAAFRQHASSQAYWQGFPPSTKRAILEWISLAKTDETRRKRVLLTASLAAKNERANQWKPKDAKGAK
jgi:uncharacterized protein YdeI (YjbR/CyaY-like superfamily)